MRARITVLLALLTICLVLAVPAANASTITLAQEESQEQELVNEQDEAEQSDGTNEEEGSGQSNPDAETGAEADEQAEGTSTEEQGPPWTYQMARIGIALMLLMALGLGLLYYRMIASRQRAA